MRAAVSVPYPNRPSPEGTVTPLPRRPSASAGERRNRVVLADDPTFLRDALAELLTRDGFEVVAQVSDPDELRSAVTRFRPAVVVVDARSAQFRPRHHPKTGRLDAAAEARVHDPDVGVVVLAHAVVDAVLDRLVRAGTRGIGYLLVDRVGGIDAFRTAVRRVADGGCVLAPDVAAALARRRTCDPIAEPVGTLSDREREVLSLMAEGRSNEAISEHLFLAPRTVEAHVRSIFIRLGLPPRPDDHRRVLAVLSYLRATGDLAAPASIRPPALAAAAH
ncbi:response regulator transcription factor [Cryptosporangium phraense]|uniref:Response regulator transcription factor n=1 Tax=Cryptosporangium phraense TaxID=2593070 RepID=A0A545AES8_9ACTN|nr:response regulator transcription factor [Cryptosporangium phraense]TQS39832.1 response regulator transcription factor [Cryptosporangium phraense]